MKRPYEYARPRQESTEIEMRAITKFLMCTMMSSNVSTDEVALIDKENYY